MKNESLYLLFFYKKNVLQIFLKEVPDLSKNKKSRVTKNILAYKCINNNLVLPHIAYYKLKNYYSKMEIHKRSTDVAPFKVPIL